MRPSYSHLRLVALPLLLLFAVTLTACPGPATVRSVSAGISVASDEGLREVADAFEAGELTAREARMADAALREIHDTAEEVRASSANWEQMKTSDQRALARLAVNRLTSLLERLEENAGGVSAEKGRRKLLGYARRGRRALAVLRVIEAALPEGPRSE